MIWWGEGGNTNHIAVIIWTDIATFTISGNTSIHRHLLRTRHVFTRREEEKKIHFSCVSCDLDIGPSAYCCVDVLSSPTVDHH